MTGNTALLSDQVFQLNTFLWALEDLPEGGSTEPILRRAGYKLSAVGQRVIVPTEESVVAALKSLTGSPDRSPVRPDLWLRHSSDVVDPLIELKAHGFSTESSNRRQALKIIASAADLSASLGETSKRPGHVIYATVSSDAGELSETLNNLAGELMFNNVATAPTAVLGFSMEEGGVALSSPSPEDLPKPAATVLSELAIVLIRDDTNDLSPLYFIPWIPGIDDSQDPELRSAGLRELTARVLIQALAEVGQARAPTTIVFDGFRLLDQATFGIFNYWRDSDKKQFSTAVLRIIERTLRSVIKVNRNTAYLVEIALPDSSTQDSVIERLERADPADPISNLQEEIEAPPTLFDS